MDEEIVSAGDLRTHLDFLRGEGAKIAAVVPHRMEYAGKDGGHDVYKVTHFKVLSYDPETEV